MKSFIAFIVVLLITGNALANPPNKISAQYNADRHELIVIVEHLVTNRTEHFIKQISVSVNGFGMENRTFDFQVSRRHQSTPPFKLTLKPGDRVEVFAKCNKFGEGHTLLTIK
jgi:hypothetical protein